MAESQSDSRHPFSADRPIVSQSEDLLSRSDFAISLARAIESWRHNDSLVIAVYGPWGSGKSSVKNMVLEQLGVKPPTEAAPVIVEFNPWQWAAQDQLFEAFFREVESGLGKVDRSADHKKRAAKWRKYATYMRVGSTLTSGIRRVGAAAFALLAATGLSVAIFQEGWTKTLAGIIGGVGVLLAVTFQWGGKVADAMAAALGNATEAQARGLKQVRTELSDLLAKLTAPVVVVIDDLDRLTPEETRLMFQLVKSNADFPNLVYLLLFERDRIERAMDVIHPNQGREFLEKIVQVGFDLPQIQRSRLERVLFARLDEMLSIPEVGARFDQTRWGNIFIPGLGPYFENLRDVNRYAATLSFHVSLLTGTGAFEVNPIDLIALEVLRVFESDVYTALPDAKPTLTRASEGLRGRAGEDEARALVTGLVDRVPEDRRDRVRSILKNLFPTVEWVFGGSHYASDFADRWFRDLRVCHSDVFDRYFHLAIPEGDISQAQIDLILSLVGNRDDLVREFRALKERELLGVLLDRLEAYKEALDLSGAQAFVTALFDIGDELPEGQRGMFGFGADMHASRIIHWYLKQEPDKSRRASILADAIRETEGLYLPVMKISLEDSRQERQEDPDAFLVEDSDLPTLRSLAVDTIRSAAADGRLIAHPKMEYILFRWIEWSNEDEPRDWVSKQIERDQGILALLKAFVSPVRTHGMTDYVARTSYRMNLADLERFASLGTVTAGVSRLDTADLNDEEKRSIDVFQRALKRRAEGKTDDPLSWSRDDVE